MAITIYDQPDTFTPAFNDQVFVVLSDKRTQDNFKYIFDIWFSGSTSYDIRVALPPDSGGYGVFDARKIVEDYVSYDITLPDSTALKQNTNSYKGYSIRFGEEFGLSTSGTTVYAALTSGSTVLAYNSVFGFEDFVDYNQNDWLCDDSSAKYLTNFPRLNRASKTIIDIRSSQNAWLHLITNAQNNVRYVRVATYTAANGGGSINGNFLISNDFWGFTSEADRFLRIPTGTNNLNDIPSGKITVSVGALPIIDSDVLSYRISTENSGSTNTSEQIYYNIDDVCTKYEVYRLHFLNKMGGFDSFNFIRKSRKSSEITRTTSKRLVGERTGTTWGYAKKDRGRLTHHVTDQDRLTLTTDWIKETEWLWLKELVTSPEVYWEKSTSVFIAMNVTTVGYEEKKEVNDNFFTLELQLDYSYENYRQRL